MDPLILIALITAKISLKGFLYWQFKDTKCCRCRPDEKDTEVVFYSETKSTNKN